VARVAYQPEPPSVPGQPEVGAVDVEEETVLGA